MLSFKKRPFQIFVLIILSVFIFFVRDVYNYSMLYINEEIIDGSNEKSLKYANNLRDTWFGVHMSLRNINIYTDDYDRWFSWILINTHRENVEKKLISIATSNEYELSKQVEALIILFKRTNCCDYLVDIYSKVRGRGSFATWRGRMKLSAIFESYNIPKQIILQINKKNNEKLSIKLGEFIEIVNKFIAGCH
ncbi:MAG: hypothetical protein KKA60_02630 [Proteobacteria bacterium]|nr:hypothetical protein [Pseudomonadota bacterium]